jgi:hypothetical protein
VNAQPRKFLWFLAVCGAAVVAVPSAAGGQATSGMTMSVTQAPMTTPPPPTTPTPPNTITATCPKQTMGTPCTITWTDNSGPVSATFIFRQNKMRQSQTVHLFCASSTCQVTAQGWAPDAIPRKWTVTGNNVKLVSITSTF